MSTKMLQLKELIRQGSGFRAFLSPNRLENWATGFSTTTSSVTERDLSGLHPDDYRYFSREFLRGS